jgi:hypothetical protein
VSAHLRLQYLNQIVSVLPRFDASGAVVPGPPPYWLFLLFAVYGPSVNAVGELRYVEVVVLVLFLLNFNRALQLTGQWEHRLAGLFFLAAIATIVSDIANDAAINGTLKRVGTYSMLALLVIAMKWLGRADPKRILIIVAGYCASWVFVLFLGNSASALYVAEPWRLGLGMAATTFLCVLIAWFRQIERVGALALIGLAGLHLALAGRSLAIVTGLTGLLTLASQLKRPGPPPRFSPGLVLFGALTGAVCILAVSQGMKFATENNLFSEEQQVKIEQQETNPYGILTAGRPDTSAALYGITKSPLLGFGSTNVDPDVYAFYVERAAASYIWQDNYSELVDQAWQVEWMVGTPSHSHIFGAWVDAGVLAALCWFLVLYLSVYVVLRMMHWRHPFMPLSVLLALATMWDVLFSPGPHRMDMAIRLMVLVYAHELLRSFDARPFAGARGWAQFRRPDGADAPSR